GFSVGPAFSALDLVVMSNGLVRAWGGFGSATNVPATISGISAVEGAGGIDQSTGISLAIRSNRTVIGWGGNIGSVSSLTNVPPGVSNVVTLAGGLRHVLARVDNGAPLIIRPPVGGTFYTGRDLALRAKAIGTAPLSFQWFKDGNPIPGATDESLVLNFALTNDVGSYHLIVSNALGVAQSVAVPVTLVDRAPALMSQVQSRYAYYGSPFSVGASVIGSGPIDFQWLQNGVPAYNGTNALVFNRALPQHDGNYQLIVSNPFGSVTSSVAQIKFSRIANWIGSPGLSNFPVDLKTVAKAKYDGYNTVIGIRTNGTVFVSIPTPPTSVIPALTNIPTGLTGVVDVTCKAGSALALKSDGTVVAWGSNSGGQTNVPLGLNAVQAIASGANFGMALRSNGTVVAWGSITSPPSGLSNVVAISAGQGHGLALKSDGTIAGLGSYGSIPPHANIVAIDCYANGNLALRTDGTLMGWRNSGTLMNLPSSLTNIVAMTLGGIDPDYYLVASRNDGALVSATMYVYLSPGLRPFYQDSYPSELTSVVSLSASWSNTIAILSDRSPVITAQSFGRHATSGTNVTLAALAVGQPNLNFQWRVNGNDIPGATGPTLTLTNVNRDSRGYYSALVGNSLGSTTSREAWLDVVGPVRLLTTTGGSANTLSFVATDGSGAALTAEEAAWLEVQASTNLLNWQTVTNALTFTNGALLLQDPAQSNYPTRFYRLIER
ncbi:MAG: hypothetical protein AAB370_10670, partial [Verrucomicrobiota bacterium]